MEPKISTALPEHGLSMLLLGTYINLVEIPIWAKNPDSTVLMLGLSIFLCVALLTRWCGNWWRSIYALIITNYLIFILLSVSIEFNGAFLWFSLGIAALCGSAACLFLPDADKYYQSTT